jgi:hypothetical protein
LINLLQPDPLWQSDRNRDDSPEAKLIYAIILQAWKDSTSELKTKRRKVRSWFYSPQFEEFCELLNINSSIMRKRVIQSWKIK